MYVYNIRIILLHVVKVKGIGIYVKITYNISVSTASFKEWFTREMLW